MQGKIIKGIAGFYYVYAEETDTIYECKAKGIFRNRKVKPLVGDLVAIEVLDEEQAKGNITEILPRKNELIRPASANVDQAMVIFAAANPEPNFHLLDRFLVMMLITLNMFIPDNHYFLVGIFCFMVITLSALLYQIIKKI